LQGQSISLNVKISEEIAGDSIYVESPTDITTNYNRSEKLLTITNIALDNDFANPAYINLYRDDPYKLQRRMLIGKLAVVGRPRFESIINVQIVYFASDTAHVKNMVNPTRLQNLLNSNSLNQSFVHFAVLPKIIRIKDSLNNDAKGKTYDAYIAIQQICKDEGMVITRNQHPTTVYVVLTDLKFSSTDGDKISEIGGGVMSNNNLAIMWTIENRAQDKEKLIIHEIGHTLGLQDVFNDNGLGLPSAGFSRHNYMDYNIVRNMFFKTQIKTIIDNLNKKATL
jgi:predicted Zn-dependent protease